MTRSAVLGDLTTAEMEELNRATEAMRRNQMRRHALAGDVDGYLQFLDDRQELFGHCATITKKNYLVIDKSVVL